MSEGSVPGGGLGGVAARGMAVSLAGQGVRVLLQVAGTVVLARLLTPSDFGLVAMVSIVVAVTDIFRDLGLSVAAIRAPALTRQQRDNLFWINSALGLVLAVLTFAAAGAVAWFYGEPRLVEITQALALTFVVNGLSTQFRSDLTRRLRFKTIVASDVVAQAVGLAVGISLALLLRTYWAIVAQQVVQSVVSLTVQVLAAGWLPGRPRRRAGTLDLVRFGASYVVSQFIGYVSSNVDTAIVGYRFGPGPVGVYSRSYQLLMMPLTQLRNPTTSVALPVLARLADDPPRQGRMLLRCQTGLGYTLVALLALVAGGADPFVRIFLGDQWLEAVPLVQAFAVAAAATTLGYVGNWVFLERGLTGDLVRWTAFSAAVRVACIAVGSLAGVVGVAIGFALAPLVLSPASLWWLGRRTPLPVRALVGGYARSLGVATVAAVVSATVLAELGPGRPWLAGVLAVLVVGATYLLAMLVPAVRRDAGDLRLVVAGLRDKGVSAGG